MRIIRIRPQILLAMILLTAIAVVALCLDVPAGKEVALVVSAGIIATMHKLVEPD